MLEKPTPSKNFIFGFNFPKEAIDNLGKLTTKEASTTIDLSFYSDLLKSQFPRIQELNIGPPLYVELTNDNDGSFLIDSSSLIRFNYLFFENVPSNEIIWENVYKIIQKISEKLFFTKIEKFGIRIIEKIPNFEYLKKSQSNFDEFLNENKIFDSKSKYLFFKNTVFFEKTNKRYAVNFEPVIANHEMVFFDMDVRVTMEIPITNLNEILKQELRFYSNIKSNINK